MIKALSKFSHTLYEPKNSCLIVQYNLLFPSLPYVRRFVAVTEIKI